MSFGSAESQMEERLPVKYFRSFPLPNFSTEENVHAAINFVPREGDVLLSSYPFGISLWVIQSIWKLVNLGKRNSDMTNFLSNLQCTEAIGTAHLNDVVGPRLIRCNLPYWITNKNTQAKYIYMTRNPKDILVAYYLSSVVENCLEISFDHFFHDFIRGLLPYGNYFDHLRSWYVNRQSNILFLNYENMHVNPKRSILQIASFLGRKHYEMCLDDSVMDYILQIPKQDYRNFTVEGDGLLNCLSQLIEKHNSYHQSLLMDICQGSLILNTVICCVGIWRNYLYLTEPLNEIIDSKITEEFSREIYRPMEETKLLDMLSV